MKRSLSRRGRAALAPWRGRAALAFVLLAALAATVAPTDARAAEVQGRLLLAQQVEPQGGRVGHIRRNAQGQIELVAPPSPAPAATSPAATSPAATPPAAAASPPATSAPVPARQAAPAGLPPAPAPVAAPSPQAAPPPKAAPPSRAAPAAANAGGQTAAPRGGAIGAGWAYERRCPDSVLLCLGVIGGDAAQENVPLTFGHPLAPKLLRPTERLVATLGELKMPVQLDQIATHNDGSVRFAIFSLVLPKLAAGGPHKLEIDQDATTQLPTPPPIAPLPTDLRVEIETYAAPIYQVTFGDRKTPFAVGERITLIVGEGAAEERYTVTVTPEMAKPGFAGGTEIAKAFVATMAKSARYLAHRDALPVYEQVWVTLRQKPGSPFSLRVGYEGRAVVSSALMQTWEPRQRHNIKLDPSISRRLWLDGPLAREVIGTYSLPSRGLSIDMAIRQHAGKAGYRLEVVYENTFALPGGIKSLEYDTKLALGGNVAVQFLDLQHRAFTRWRLLEPNAERATVVIHDRLRLFDSRAIISYDRALRPTEATIARTYEQFLRSDREPLGTAMITRYMPMTGGRSDIGMLPAWASLHILSQDPRLMRVVLGNGNASGSVPIHYRDGSSRRLLNVATHANVRIYGGLSVGDNLVQQGFNLSNVAADTAHQPSLAYYPFLLSGERYYLEELHFWASWNALVAPVKGRNGSQGILGQDQVRGQAWTLRTLAQAALITSDDHPWKATFSNQLAANIAWYNKEYQTHLPQQQGRLPGWLASNNPEMMAPWQQDLMVIVLSYLADNDVAGSRQLMLWLGRFVAGRFLADAEGYCRSAAPAYWIRFADRSKGVVAQSWAEFYRLNWPEQRSCALTSWVDRSAACTYCYTSMARGALAALINVGVSQAREPYDFIRSQTENRNADFASDPTFAIVPR